MSEYEKENEKLTTIDTEEKLVKDEEVTKKIEHDEIVETDEYKLYKKQGETLFNGIENNIGKIYIKNFKKNNYSNTIKIDNKSCANIIKKGDLKTVFRSFLITAVYNETVSMSNILDDEDDEKYDKLVDKKENYVVLSTKYKNLAFEEKKRHQAIIPKKAFQNIFKKMGESMSEILDYMEIIIIEMTVENLDKELITHRRNRYVQLIKSHNLYYIKVPKTQGENSKNIKLDKKYIKSGLPFLTSFSLNKIMDMSQENTNTDNSNFLNLEDKNKDIENFEKKKNKYLNKIIKNAENMDIYQKYKKQETNILEKWNKIAKIQTPRITYPSNKSQQIFLSNTRNKLEEILRIIKNKKDEINKNISDNKNHFIEIEDNNGDKKYINVKYLQLIKDHRNNNKECPIENYLVNDYLSNQVFIPYKNVENYKNNEDKIYVLTNLDNNKTNQNLIKKNDLNKLYNDWKILNSKKKIPNKDGNTSEIVLSEGNIVNFGEVNNLPEQPELLKKQKEKEEAKQREIERKKEEERKKEIEKQKEEERQKEIEKQKLTKENELINIQNEERKLLDDAEFLKKTKFGEYYKKLRFKDTFIIRRLIKKRRPKKNKIKC